MKYLFLLLLTFLLGTSTTHAKTELVLPQKQVVFSVEQTPKTSTLEKEVQPNVGFLKEKTKFVTVDDVSAVNTFAFAERVGGKLAKAGGDIAKLTSILQKSEFTSIFNKLKNLPTTPNRAIRYASINAFRDEFIRLHSLNSTGIKSLDKVLDDFDNLVTNYSNVTNIEKYVDELMQTSTKFKGGAYGLEILNNLPQTSLNGKTLVKFEASIDDLADASTGCRFDLQFSDGTQMIFVETKNYASTTSFTSSFYNQFKAYISNPNVTNINQIKYFFRANTGVTKAERVQKFKNMINNGNNKVEFFNSLNPTLRAKHQIEFANDIDDAFLDTFLNTIIEVY